MKKESISLSFLFSVGLLLDLPVRVLQLPIIILLFFTLLSCEGASNLRGHVYDNTTKRSIDSVQVILILGKDDTFWKCKPSITADNQNDISREKYQLAFTDTSGYFSISSGLIAMGPGELKAKVLFTKTGYTPVIITKGEGSKFDSVLMQQIK